MKAHSLCLLALSFVSQAYSATLIDWNRREFTIPGEIDYNIRDTNRLRDLDFSNTDFRGVRMIFTSFTGSDFSNSLLGGADLFHSNFAQALFIGADLRNVSFDSGGLMGADLTNASIEGADFNAVILDTTIFNNTRYSLETNFPVTFDPTSEPGLVLVPEPSSMLLVSLGSLMICRRKRQAGEMG